MEILKTPKLKTNRWLSGVEALGWLSKVEGQMSQVGSVAECNFGKIFKT
jgi:hypothetical protein